MARGIRKHTHNAKTLRKYKTAELRNFIKENKLPMKRTSKLTKTEIVSNLLKIQRNGNCECFIKLPIRGKKKLTELQKQALLKGQNAMRERRKKLKEQVKPSQKLDKKPIKIPVTKEIIEEIRDEIRKEQEPTQLEKIKFEGMPNQVFDDILSLDDLFNRADVVNKRDVDFFNELFGFLEKKEVTLNPEAEVFVPKEEKSSKEEEEPSNREVSKAEENFRKKELNIFTKKELQKICKDNNIKNFWTKNKAELVNLVFINEKNIENLQDLLEKKRESKL